MIYVTHDQVEAMTLSDRVVVLDKGKVSQFGTPLELFYQPANLFVAGFIGSPRMNFFDVTASSAGSSGISLSGDGLTRAVVFDADPPVIRTSGKFTLGIRPDKIEIVSAGEGEIAGTVRLVERLGTESHVHISLEDGRAMTAVVRGTHPVANGEMVHLRLPPQHCYLFDAEGNAVRRRLDAETQALIHHEKGKRVA
jgi:multiple sugar transport system ATP-binding protein